MANLNSVIDVRGAPFQPCWGCGKTAGGREAHQYYGNFPRGVEHGDCADRIRTILDRSIRALSALDTEMGKQTGETLMQALITTSARKLDNRNLDEIKDDQVIRSAVETEGLKAAIQTFRALSNMDDSTWDLRLKEHEKIMQGPEVVKEKTDEEALRLFREMMNGMAEDLKREQEKRNAALLRLSDQMSAFRLRWQQSPKMNPYCILKDVIGPYFNNSNGCKDLKGLFSEIESTGKIKVLFLAKESQDPVSQSITHVVVKHIALRPSAGEFVDSQRAWGINGPGSVVLPFECLEWSDHWVYIEEIGERISNGEGSKKRPPHLSLAFGSSYK